MDWSNRWKVGTRLVPDEEIDKWKSCGLVPELPGSNVYFTAYDMDKASCVLAVDKPLYLHCAYDEMDDIFEKTYEGHCLGKVFHYRLKRNRTFIEEIEQNLLARTAALYHINKPLIFAPDARRAVDICVTDGLSVSDLIVHAEQKDGKYIIDAPVLEKADWEIDLLNGRLRTNMRLILTNVKLSPKPLDFAKDGKNEFGRYFDIPGSLPKDTLIIPCTPTQNNDVLEIEADDNESPFRVYVNEDVDLRTYDTIAFGEVAPDDWENLYRNDVNLPRLRTANDVDEICRCFTDEARGLSVGFKCVVQPGESAPTNIIRRYERQDRYPDWGNTEELFKARRYRPICYLNFSGAGVYLGDWAEYVLAAFEKNYPEFIWAGVRDDT